MGSMAERRLSSRVILGRQAALASGSNESLLCRKAHKELTGFSVSGAIGMPYQRCAASMATLGYSSRPDG